MAAIYNQDGYYVTEGLQGCDVCDEAARAARDIASDRDEAVILEDNDGTWLVHPTGRRESFAWG